MIYSKSVDSTYICRVRMSTDEQETVLEVEYRPLKPGEMVVDSKR